MEDSYGIHQSVIMTYCKGSPLLKVLSERNRITKFRQLWHWLAQAEMELGLTYITPDMVNELRSNITNIDFEKFNEINEKAANDVVAHIMAYAAACPTAGDIIHLGATSMYPKDNAQLMVMQEALDIILQSLLACIKSLSDFAKQYKDLPTLGITHGQPATIITVGKRAAMWTKSLLTSFEEIEKVKDGIEFRGCKGVTGTQDSFLFLFDGNGDKVEALDERVTQLAGFKTGQKICGQSYDRLVDCKVLNGLAMCGAAVQKITNDIQRLLSFRELSQTQVFNKTEQVGSSAMPYKINPEVSSETIGIARYLMNLPQNALQNVANSGLERSADDTTSRKIILSDAYMAAEAMLKKFKSVIQEELVVAEKNIRARVLKEIPFLTQERLTLILVRNGKNRQEVHEKFRNVSLVARELMENGQPFDLYKILSQDPFFDQVLDDYKYLIENPLILSGRSSEQVDRFIVNEVEPVLKRFKIN